MILARIFALGWTAAVLLVLTSLPANAGPLVGVFTGIVAAIQGSTVLTALAKLAGSIILSKVATKLRGKPRQPGIKSESTQTGSQVPASFIVGRYATGGAFVCPPMSSDVAGVPASLFTLAFNTGGVPKGLLTYVIEVGDVAGQQLESLIVDGVRIDVADCVADGTSGFLKPAAGKFANALNFRFYDGTQTAADAFLMANYAAGDRPWQSDMVGRGICYVVINFPFNRSLFSAFPTVRFVVVGIPLYDPRKDSTAGGSGAHRWNDLSTWEWSNNPMVILYNMHRGIAVQGNVWGGRNLPDALPSASWFAAMNACDALVDDGLGGTEKAFRASYEVITSEEPAAVAEEILKAANAEIADMGGRWVVQVNDGGLPVFAITDESLVSTKAGDRTKFPPPPEIFNAVAANYPEPLQQWEASAAPLVINANWQAEDGGRRLLLSVDYPAVPWPSQVQRLMRLTLAAERRFLTHAEVLPPEAVVLDVTDTLIWDSEEYGYGAKLFQIGRISEDLQTGLISLSLRERDPNALAIPPGYFTPPVAVAASGSDPSSGPLGAPSSFVVGYDWQGVTPAAVLSSAAPTYFLGSFQTGTFPALRAGTAYVGAEVTLTGAGVRHVRLANLTSKPQAEAVFALFPGVTLRLTATGTVPDVPAGAASLTAHVFLEALDLLSGETIDVTEVTSKRVYFLL